MQIRVAIAGAAGDVERVPEFSKPEISIGRLPTNDVVLPEAGVSSNHARVLVTGGALTIVDLESTNGTFVNDEPLRGPRVIADHDEVQIGDFTLRFSLSGAIVDAAPFVPAPRSSSGTVAELSGGFGEPPPMLDDDGVSASTGIAAPGPRSAPAIARDHASAPPRPAMFPAFAPPVRPSAAAAPAPAPRVEVGFEFSGASGPELVDRIFAAIWARVADDVVFGTAGARERVTAMIDEALAGASVPKPAELRARMLEEMLGEGPSRALLEGDPTEVLVLGTTRVRTNRGGHVTEGPSPFSCASAVSCFVSRAIRAPFDPSRASARGNVGAYALEAMWGAGCGGAPIVSLRRSAMQGNVTLEGLFHAGVMSPGMASLLGTCVVARQNIVVCTGPGANARPLLAALLACAPPLELQVLVAHRGIDTAPFRPSTVVVTRTPAGHDVIDAALALGPDRLAIDDLQPTEAGGAMSVISRSLGLLLAMRAHSPMGGLAQLDAVMTAALPRVGVAPLLVQSIDLLIGVQLFADGITRVTQIAEPVLVEGRGLVAQDVFMLVPGSRTWQFGGVLPRCHEELSRRGFRLDPAIFA